MQTYGSNVPESVVVPLPFTDFTGFAKRPVKPTTNSTTIATTATTTTGMPHAGAAGSGRRTRPPLPERPARGGRRILHGTGTVPKSAMRQPIVFVTDYGRDDAYAAALTGAAWRVDPHAICVDGTHGIPPGDVLAGAYQLKALGACVRRGAVFCAVVDPGVGTERRAIAVEVGRIRCVAPDNGLVSYLWEEAPATSGGRSASTSRSTRHPPSTVATSSPRRRAAGVGGRLEAAGELIDDPIVLADAFAERAATGLTGASWSSITSATRSPPSGMPTSGGVGALGELAGWRVPGLVTTYADIDAGPLR